MATFKRNPRAEKISSIVTSGIFLLLVVNCQFVAAALSVTWTAPPPAWTQTDRNNIRTVDMPVRNGSTQVHLRWSYTLSSGSKLLFTTFSIDDGLTSEDIGVNIGGAISVNDETRFNISRSEVATLIIKEVTKREKATFQCKLTVQGSVWAYDIRVIVTVPVELTNVSGDQTVHEGTNMTLLCNATGEPKPNITWTKVLGDGSNSEVLYQGPTWDFPNINRTASGTYCCTADSGFESVNHKVKVNVIYPAKIIKFPSEYKVAAQESLSLHCQAEGNPQPTYTWTPCDSKNSVCDDSKLNVPATRNNSVYMYTCKVENYLGINTRNTSVFIASDVINVTLVITSESCTKDGEYDQALWEKLSTKINEVFANKIGYKSVQLKDFRCGSVIVDVALKFSSTVKEINVISILQDAVEKRMFGDFNVSAITGTRHDTETTTVATTPTSPSGSETTWIIVGAVLGSLVVVAVVVAVIAWCVRKKRKCNRKDTKVHSSESQEQGTENVQGGNGEVNPGYVTVESNHNPRVANPPSVTYDTVEQSRKRQREVSKDTPTVSYAVVDKSKQKKKDKKPKPGELQYAELAEFNPRSQGMPRSSASYGQGHPTETQYADVNAM